MPDTRAYETDASKPGLCRTGIAWHGSGAAEDFMSVVLLDRVLKEEPQAGGRGQGSAERQGGLNRSDSVCFTCAQGCMGGSEPISVSYIAPKFPCRASLYALEPLTSTVHVRRWSRDRVRRLSRA